MFKRRFWAIILILIAAGIGYFVYSTNNADSVKKFKLGLDLNGGIELIYKADTIGIPTKDVGDRINSLRDLIEKRVNREGVSEAIIQVESVGLIGEESHQQLIVDLPGQTNLASAIAQVGKPYLLEFKFLKSEYEDATSTEGLTIDQVFEETGLTGALLEKATLDPNQNVPGEWTVGLQFNEEGSALFAKITKENVGRRLAIFLDNNLMQSPVIREEISGGKAMISGGFSGSVGAKEAKELVINLNLGALPVPIELVSTQSIGASLGSEAVKASVHAGLWAFIVIALFLVIWYRLPGLLAVFALSIYAILNLAIFKIGVSFGLILVWLIFVLLATAVHKGFFVGVPISYLLFMIIPGALSPVTLTAAGIAGFILSLGMAVDANILIFERMREELARGRVLADAIKEGFARAWLSIRDSNTSSIITAVILYAFSSTPVVKGFALVFGLGVLVSMFTAITASRTLLLAIKHDDAGKIMHFLFGSGAGSDNKLNQ